MDKIKNIREEHYMLIRYIATFIIGPFLLLKGYKYDDISITIIGLGIIIWDGLKIYYN